MYLPSEFRWSRCFLLLLATVSRSCIFFIFAKFIRNFIVALFIHSLTRRADLPTTGNAILSLRSVCHVYARLVPLHHPQEQRKYAPPHQLYEHLPSSHQYLSSHQQHQHSQHLSSHRQHGQHHHHQTAPTLAK
ncbi:hypothetical protein C8J57DRAFT_1527390 [Mycena rebaudengoi]|nr:hypothetical protein C8J57DRAFT_1527390 [Mycena rebaudengoi]